MKDKTHSFKEVSIKDKKHNLNIKIERDSLDMKELENNAAILYKKFNMSEDEYKNLRVRSSENQQDDYNDLNIVDTPVYTPKYDVNNMIAFKETNATPSEKEQFHSKASIEKLLKSYKHPKLESPKKGFRKGDSITNSPSLNGNLINLRKISTDSKNSSAIEKSEKSSYQEDSDFHTVTSIVREIT